MSIVLRLRVVAAALVVAGACGGPPPVELRTAAEASSPAVVPVDLPRPGERPTPATTSTTLPPATTTSTTVPPAATTSTTAPMAALQAAPPADSGAGDCLGWASTIAAHFPADQRAKACQVLDCETGGTGDPTIWNGSGSGASGLWQFMPDTWENVTGLPPPAADYTGDRQTAAAAALWARSGWSPWACA